VARVVVDDVVGDVVVGVGEVAAAGVVVVAEVVPPRVCLHAMNNILRYFWEYPQYLCQRLAEGISGDQLDNSLPCSR